MLPPTALPRTHTDASAAAALHGYTALHTSVYLARRRVRPPPPPRCHRQERRVVPPLQSQHAIFVAMPLSPRQPVRPVRAAPAAPPRESAGGTGEPTRPQGRCRRCLPSGPAQCCAVAAGQHHTGRTSYEAGDIRRQHDTDGNHSASGQCRYAKHDTRAGGAEARTLGSLASVSSPMRSRASRAA
jgi:hypothetical protein